MPDGKGFTGLPSAVFCGALGVLAQLARNSRLTVAVKWAATRMKGMSVEMWGRGV